MPRTLPWLVMEDDRTSRKLAIDTSARLKAEQITQGTRKCQGSETSSTSVLPPPPPNEAMRKTDEVWIMVEDELLATAKTFTRNLHIAEYNRLRCQAQGKKGAALSILKRPTHLRIGMSVESTMVKAQEWQEMNTYKAADRLDGHAEKRRKTSDSEDNDSDVAIGDHNLAGLMQRPSRRKSDKPTLSRLASSSISDMRAAAGNQAGHLQPKRRSALPSDDRSQPHPRVKARSQPSIAGNSSSSTSSKLDRQVSSTPEEINRRPMIASSKTENRPDPLIKKQKNQRGNSRLERNPCVKRFSETADAFHEGVTRGDPKPRPFKPALRNRSSQAPAPKAMNLQEIPFFLV